MASPSSPRSFEDQANGNQAGDEFKPIGTKLEAIAPGNVDR